MIQQVNQMLSQINPLRKEELLRKRRRKERKRKVKRKRIGKYQMKK